MSNDYKANKSKKEKSDSEELSLLESNNVNNVEKAAPETINENDKMILELAKMQRKVALANAEKALAQNEAAETAYKFLVLQVYVKYKLDPEKDSLDETGNILRNTGSTQ